MRAIQPAPLKRVLALSNGITTDTAAALLFNGMTTEYLLNRVHQVRAGD